MFISQLPLHETLIISQIAFNLQHQISALSILQSPKIELHPPTCLRMHHASQNINDLHILGSFQLEDCLVCKGAQEIA